MDKQKHNVNGERVSEKLLDDEIQLEIKNSPNQEVTVVYEKENSNRMIYGVEDNPPFYLTLLFAFQQTILSIPNCTFVVALIAEVVCAQNIDAIKAKMFATTVFLAGITTLFQNTLGVRIPVYQGPVSQYVISLMALSSSLPEWKCPENALLDIQVNGTSNITSADLIQNYTDTYVIPKIQIFQGSLMLAGFLHMLVGLTGVLGILLRFIGPLTIVPALLLVGIKFCMVLGKFCQSSWAVASVTALTALILGLYLKKFDMPIIVWSRRKGFHTTRYPLHRVFSMLIAMMVGWAFSGILTAAGVLSSDPESPDRNARTDTRMGAIDTTPWFYFPYPGQFGSSAFSIGVFISFLVPTLISILDSIADYYACARTVMAPSPPQHAINRGIVVEGFFSMIAGAFGAGHATTTSGMSIGVIGITKVGSRRVFQMFGIQLMILAVIGKFSAFFITIPYPVLGGILLVAVGLFLGVVMSNLQFIDLNSTRNLGVLGISLGLGLLIPTWSEKNPTAFHTGVKEVDDLIVMLMTNPNFFGAVIACLLDNTLPGTQKERGMLTWQKGSEDDDDDEAFEVGKDIYDMPPFTRFISKFRYSKYIPVFPNYVHE